MCEFEGGLRGLEGGWVRREGWWLGGRGGWMGRVLNESQSLARKIVPQRRKANLLSTQICNRSARRLGLQRREDDLRRGRAQDSSFPTGVERPPARGSNNAMK